jgi:myotubularin-related protein 10/11/12
MADLLPTIQDRTQENMLLEHIRKSHPEKKQPYIIDLSKECPSPKEIQSSFLKLRDLCVPENLRTFKNQDFKFYGLLDSTKWMSHVSTCLCKALEAVNQILDQTSTVVLQEGALLRFNFALYYNPTLQVTVKTSIASFQV